MTDNSAEVCDDEDEEGDADGEVCGGGIDAPLARQDLYSFLQVDECDVEAENVAGETRYVFEAVAGICYGEDPVED